MSRAVDRRTRRFLCAVVTLNFSVVAFAATGNSALIQSTPPEPPSVASNPGAGQVMVLEVVLNNTDTHEILNVERAADGNFSARAGDLRHLRLRIDLAIAPDAMVRLRDLAGMVVRYDEAAQSLTLQAPTSLLESYQVNLGGESQPTDLKSMRPLSSAILNYGLYDTWQSGRNYVSGNFEGLLTNRAGVFSTTALYNQNATPGYSKSVRLDSSWRYIDPEKIRSYTVGDFVSNALSWNNSVRLAGFQIASAFDQRPDVVTAALPKFTGSAALPSTLDLYVNQQQVFSGNVPSGPYQLKSLPSISGGNVTLVATDATGRQITTTQAYYYNGQQLKQGLLEYSLDVGVPRLNYGAKSADYDNTLFAAGSLRYGLTNSTTFEGHAESSADGLANLGAGIVQSLGGYGSVTTSLAGSHYKNWSGGQAALQVEGMVGGVHLYAGTQRIISDYYDLARVSSYRYQRHNPLLDSEGVYDPLTTAQASAIDRAGLSFQPWFDATTVDISYNRIKYSGSMLRTVNLALSRSLSRRVSLFANAFTDVDNHDDRGAYLSVNITLDRNITAQATVTSDDGHMGLSQQVNGLSGQRQGDVGWGVANATYADAPDQSSAYVNWRTPQAQLRAQVYQYGNSTSSNLSVEGSLVAAGGGLFAADQIGNAYAIVTNAGPGAEVMQGGVLIGQANSNGRALLPNITPYYEQHVYLDPSTMADGWVPAVTERVAVAGFRQGTIVDFGAKLVHAAVLVLRGKDGKLLGPGYTAHLEGGDNFVVGYDGEVYVSGLTAHNRVTVDFGSAGSCAANFDYDMKSPAQAKIGPLTCH
ncbi:fimbria/pilus outer membrane usher protein [Rhodanobacter sp. L36]|uniref:fimbria/pilus outer membrane usher protein n=1 Tax=Rhodanobacter sp. L36 TaxID=1747221 RepID=UPI00131E4192|nr:fimbria/pilus outer membrane usher protein [Rhodanobacter sp. L36]